MSTLLLEHINTLATFNPDRQILQNAWILIEDHQIKQLGTGKFKSQPVDQRLDLSDYVVLPGLINLHHHFFQALLRNVPSLQDASLFNWIRSMRMLSSEISEEDLDVATRVNIAELLLSGCTTAVDHCYVRAKPLSHDVEIKAAQEMGIRFHFARGSRSMKIGASTHMREDGLEDLDDILADTERLIKQYHDPQPFAMLRIENAPGTPLSTSERMWVESIALARKYGCGNHTHMAEAPDEEQYTLTTFGKRSVERAEELGWVGPDVWYAHATRLSPTEKTIIQRTGTGICHCPTSNMYTSASICEVAPMLQAGGFKIGLGVDGSAANNSSHLLKEARHALLLQRTAFGADALSPTQALELAILGGASILRRDEIGVLAPGKAADLIGINMNKLAFAGGLHDPLAALILCETDRVDLSIVNGKILVEKGQVIGLDTSELIRKANQHSRALMQRTEKRYDVSLSQPQWRRAYPYDC
jgi:cytosine/adenosine deaminase-related metal-dependent hydrolase